MSVKIDNVVLSDEMKKFIAFFQDEQDGQLFLDKLDGLLDKIIDSDTYSDSDKLDNIAVIREIYKFINCIHKTAKEGGIWQK